MRQPYPQSSIAALALALATLSLFAVMEQVHLHGLAASTLCRPGVNDLLETHISSFDSNGKPMMDLVVGLAYRYKIPMALEYVDHRAAAKPIKLRLHQQTVFAVLAKVVGDVPGFKISVTNGLVQVYSPGSRSDPANLLNRVIRSYNVSGVDTEQASAELSCTLARELNPRVMCFSSIVPGQWGKRKITLRARDLKVYQILNEITAQNGEAIWTVLVPPGGLSIPGHDLWYIYPLTPQTEATVANRLDALFPRQTPIVTE